jgi:hypothetical protein
MDAVLDLVRVLFEPAAVFARVRERPRFLAPFLAIAAISVLVGVLQLPYTRAALTAQFSQMPNMPPGAAERALSFAPLGVIFAPVFFAFILVVSTLILWMTVSVVAGEAKFMTLLSVTTYAAIAYILLAIIGLVVLTLRGTVGITGTEDLQPALGLDLLAPGAKGFGLALLRGINPFSLYGVFLTATGVQTTHQVSRGAAYTAAAVQFVLALLLTGALAALGPRG